MTVDKIITPPTKDEVVDKINEVIDNLGGQGTAPVWGNISGTLSNQTDLQSALDLKADDTNVVHKTGSETITGFKTFTNKAKITSTTEGAILELESDADNTNFLLKRTGGSTCVLESGSSVGLFGTKSAHALQIRTNYKTRMTFDTSGNVTLAKAPSSDSNSNQVATTAWTISKIPTNNNQLTNGAGYITGITSSDVTNALGYIPYNSTNPNGYITASALNGYATEQWVTNKSYVTSVNNIQPVNGNVTLTIPDTSNLANKDLSNLSSTGNSKFQVPLVSGTNIKTINNNSILGSGNLVLDGLPTQTGKAGKFLTTDGTDASWGVVKTHNLLEFKWSDHLLDDVSWLRADTFSWQSGDVYTSAYNHLVQDIQGTTAETETIGSYTVTFYRATDGHKICLADQETTIANIYSETGIAWYYILDTTNTQFKLPRTKYGFEGLRTNVGDKIDESLPNITGMWSARGVEFEDDWISNGVFYQADAGRNSEYSGHSTHVDAKGVGFDASRSSSTYQDNAPVQERATQMYLYFYVGDYSQTAIEQTAGITSEQLNAKVDVNSLSEIYPIIETYVNGTSGYNLYSNGYCEQWGMAVKPSQGANTLVAATANLLKEMANTNYNVSYCCLVDGGNTYEMTQNHCNKTTSTIGIGFFSTVACNSVDVAWRVCGYIS